MIIINKICSHAALHPQICTKIIHKVHLILYAHMQNSLTGQTMMMQQQPLQTREVPRGSRASHSSAACNSDLALQIMHINQRIKIKLLEGETLAQFFHKVRACVHLELCPNWHKKLIFFLQLVLYFEVVEKNSNQLGLFERRGKNDFAFVTERGQLQHDHLYYLYFREKPDKSLSING